MAISQKENFYFSFASIQTLLNRVRILASLNGMEFSEIIKLRLQNLSDKGSKKTGNFRTFIKIGLSPR